LAFAAASVWQAAQPLLAKTALPEAAAGPPSFFCWPFAHERNLSAGITFAVERISACPSPQSSVQITG